MFDSRVHGLGALAGVNDPSLVYVLAYMHCKHSQNKPFSCLYIVQKHGFNQHGVRTHARGLSNMTPNQTDMTAKIKSLLKTTCK